MQRTAWLVLVGAMSLHCGGGGGSESGSEGTSGVDTTAPTGSTGDPTVVTGSTADPATGSTADPTTGSTTDATTDTPVTTDVSTTGPPPTTDVSAEGGTTNGGPAPEFDCSALPPGVVGVAYLATLEGNGGNGGPYYWELGFADELPPGLTLTGSEEDNTAEISGLPTEAGTFMFTIILTSNGTEEQGQEQCEIEIAAAAAPTLPR